MERGGVKAGYLPRTSSPCLCWRHNKLFRCAGDGDDATYTWSQAKAMCMEKGWRLCFREELNLPGSSGCCSRRDGIDRCGYDNALVWTNTEGGLQLQNEQGRLNSDSPMKNVTQVTVDLGKLQLIRGVQIQGVNCACDDARKIAKRKIAACI